MRAVAVFPRERDVRVIEIAEPALLAPTEALVAMREVGVCGTDREICGFAYGDPPPGQDRLVLGHESLGEVVAVGSAVRRARAGDLVTITVRRPCPEPKCGPCRARRQDFCATGNFRERGIKEAHGFLAERIIDDERNLHVVPRALAGVGVLVEPLTIAEKALRVARAIAARVPGELGRAPAAVVLGAGPIGLLGAMLLRGEGYEVWVAARAGAPNPKSQITEAIGARYISTEAQPLARLSDRIGPIDLVYEAAGASRAGFDLLESLGWNGIYCFTGIPARGGRIEVDADLLMRNLVLKNQAVFGTVNAGGDDFASAIEHLGVFSARWPGALERLKTGRHPLEAAPDLLRAPARGIKDVLVFPNAG